MQIKYQKNEKKNVYSINILLSRRHKLYDKLSKLNNIMNSSNKNYLSDKKSYYFTQHKNSNNELSLNGKKRLSGIKSISHKNLFKIDENKYNNDFFDKNKDKNKTKTKFPKLYLLKNNKENNNLHLFDSIIRSSRKNTRNYFSIENNLLTNITKNKNNSYNKTLKDFCKSKFYINNICKNNSQKVFFSKKKTIIKNNDYKYINKKIDKKKHLNSSDKIDKICTTSNCCDASTNTLSLVSLQNFGNIKRYKRPLMIDYFHSEHKKFGYGFDKLKGKNKYKKPFFIVHKY